MKIFNNKKVQTESPRTSGASGRLFALVKLIQSKYLEVLNSDLLPEILILPFFILNDILKKIYDKYKKQENIKLFGIYGYFGLWGQGKTVGMTKTLYDLRRKYKDKIYIFTNYGFKLEDKPFTNWEMLLEEYDKPAIFAWDEVQNEFNSRDFKNFPTELLTILTQNRKGHGKRIYYTAQRWNRVDKVFRELTHICYECKTHFGRLTFLKGYFWEDYEEYISNSQVKFKMKVKPNRFKAFVQTDKIRSMYDSYQMLQTAKTKKYLDRNEIKNLTT